MFSLFHTIGSMLRNMFALGFAAFFGISSMVFDLKQIAEMTWASTGGLLLVLALVGAGMFVGFMALLVHLREAARKQAAASQQGRDAATEWDPDEIIACHLARRASRNPVRMPVRSADRRMPPPRRFGRKAG